jgi:energy-coupling factor transporter ATP-binding protein EcfA2
MSRIVELALYGVRHVQSMTRIAFGPGLNVLSGGVGTGKSTLCELIAALLSPELTGRFRPFIHPHHPERAQAAVVFQADDGVFYRVIRDFVKDRISLTKIESPGQTAGGLPPLASDGFSVKTELDKLFHNLTADQIDRHWFYRQSRQAAASSPSSGGGSNGASAAAGRTAPSAARSAASPATGATGSRLEELKQALAKAEETLMLDEQVMAAQDRVISLKQKLARAAQLAEERTALQAELSGFTGFDQLPPGYVALVEGLAERERALHAHLDGMQTQLQELEGDLSALPSRPIFQQRLFQVGAGLIVLAVLVALFINLPGLFRFVFLGLLFPGIGILIWAVVKDMGIQNNRAGLETKIKALKKEQESAEKQFGREQRPALELMAQTKCSSVEQFRERARNVQRLRDNIDQLTEEQAQLLAGQAVDQLQQQLQTLTSEARALEERMREAASIAAKTGMGDVASLQAEIARLESGGAAARPSAEVEFGELTGAEAPAVRGHTTPSPALDWLDALKTIWPHDQPALQTTVSSLFGKLSGGGYGKVEWTNGRLHIHSNQQQEIDPELLSRGQRDLLAVACFLAPWLTAGKSPDSPPENSMITPGRFPLLLDDPFLSLDPAAQSALLQLLRSLGATQQILLATSQPVADHAGDHRIALGIALSAAPAGAPAQAAQGKPTR